jgi:hypothetical protein
MDEIRNASTVDEMLRALSAAGLETERAADQVAQRGLGSLPVRLNEIAA